MSVSISKLVDHATQRFSIESNAMHSAYIVDEQGKEVQITAAMIRAVCRQVIGQCKKNKGH